MDKYAIAVARLELHHLGNRALPPGHGVKVVGGLDSARHVVVTERSRMDRMVREYVNLYGTLMEDMV